jgi:DNA polymerase III epsilon subunit-like protein
VDRPLHKKVLVVDVETTGLDPTKHACIEIGAVLLDEVLNPIDDYSSLIAPWEGAKIDKKSMAIHNITLKELKGARDFRSVVGEFHNRFCSGPSIPVLAGWNVWFDVAFLRILYDKTEIKWPFSHRFLDVQAIVLFFSRLEGPSLEKTVKSLLGEKQTHRAIDDARQTGKVLQHLAGKYLSTEQLSRNQRHR